MSIRFAAWKMWNRTRYYWPQAKARKRAITKIRVDVENLGENWETYCREVGMRRRPWWIP